MSQGFQLVNDGPNSKAMLVPPQMDELDGKRVSQVLETYPDGWSEVEHREVKLESDGRQILPLAPAKSSFVPTGFIASVACYTTTKP